MFGKILSRTKSLLNKGFIYVFGSSLFVELMGFIISVGVVRKFSKADYGYYTIAYNIYGYIAVFVGLGLINGILQYCSEKRGEDEKKGIYRYTFIIGTIFNLVLAVLIPLFAYLFVDTLSRVYLIAMCLWPLTTYWSNFYVMKLRVIKDNKHYMMTNISSSFIFLLSALILTRYYSIYGYILAFYIKSFVSAMIAAYYLRGNREHPSKNVISRQLKREILNYSLVCCATNFASTLLMLIDVTCINIFIGNAEIVATYKVATQIPTALLFIPSSFIIFIYPYIAENNNNVQWLRSNTRKMCAGMFALNLIIVIVLIAGAPLVVRILWGDRYTDAVPVLEILLINYLISGTFRKLYGNVLVALKKVKINLLNTVISSCLNIVLDIWFINKWGSMGAAYATLLVTVSSSAFVYIYYHLWCRKQRANA